MSITNAVRWMSAQLNEHMLPCLTELIRSELRTIREFTGLCILAASAPPPEERSRANRLHGRPAEDATACLRYAAWTSRVPTPASLHLASLSNQHAIKRTHHHGDGSSMTAPWYQNCSTPTSARLLRRVHQRTRASVLNSKFSVADHGGRQDFAFVKPLRYS